MRPELLQILQHALGVDRYGQGEQYRNHFCAGGTDVPLCQELVSMGLMYTWESEHYPYYNCSVTDAGKIAMAEASPAPPKLTRSQIRYREYMRSGNGLSFREWLDYYRREAGR